MLTPIEWATVTLFLLYAVFILVACREVLTLRPDYDREQTLSGTETRRTLDYWWGR